MNVPLRVVYDFAFATSQGQMCVLSAEYSSRVQ